jgi:pimeloyl-ACP methyl ester carboxylesterase
MLQRSTLGGFTRQETPVPTMTDDKSKWLTGAAVAVAAAGIAAAVYNRGKAKSAEAETPPVGQFADVDGARIHYLRRGQGPRVVLIHGNGVMLQDWLVSGVFDELAKTHEVIAFDRPGFGYSDRPRTTVWTPQAQARAIATVLEQIGFGPATVVGHSFGTMVALALGLNHASRVSRLVVLGGFYFPEARADLVMNAAPAIPVTGDILRYTISPLAGKAMMPAVETALFDPAPVSPKWTNEFPVPMVLRPSQVRATAGDSALAIPAAASLSKRYGELRMPVTIMGGTGDKVVTFDEHSRPLHDAVPGSRLVPVEGVGHMVHWSAQDAVLREIVGGAAA